MGFPDRLTIPSEVLRIADVLEGAGFETWCVGGAVRDTLLEEENKDFDLATAARPEQVRALFKRTIPIGIEHGTVAVLDRNRQPHEVTTFRRDVKTDGRHAEVEFGASLEDDLARRDFTINAIAYHPTRHEWRDPFNGAADLDDGVIRAVGTAWHRFREDYLRILRALRFAAKFSFEIEHATWKAARACVAGLQHLSAERVRDEWMGGLQGAKRPSELVRLWDKVGALAVWLPEVVEEPGRGKGIKSGSGKREAGTAYVGVDRFVRRDPVLITAYLSSDPGCTLSRLKCSRSEITRGEAIGRHRVEVPDPRSGVDVRRWMANVRAAADDLVAISDADGIGEGLAEAVEAVRESRAPLAVRDLAVGGDDLIGLGIPRGPVLGDTLSMLLDAVIVDPALNRREALIEIAKAKALPASRFPLHGDGKGGGP